MAHCDCYKRGRTTQRLGMLGQRYRGIDSILAGRRRGADRVFAVALLALTPVLAGCASSSPSAGTAPVTYQPASAPANPSAAPAADVTATMTPYPSRSLVDLFADDARATATGTTTAAAPPSQAAYASQRPGMPHPPGTYTASAPPYQGAQPGYDAYAGSAGAQPRPAPAAAQESAEESVPGYPTRSLTDVFSN